MEYKMALRIYNTLTRKKEEFEPILPGKAGLYCCGPTVYHYAHIGNLRAYIFNDILRRVLELDGNKVNHVMNITDVGHLTSDSDEGEDKMAKGAKREGKSVWDVAKFYTEAFFNDTDRLGILRPTVVCNATDHINEMIALVERIEANGYTYEAGGNIYFDVSKFENYAELARMDMDAEKQARVEGDAGKKNHADFVLWFTNSKFGNQDMQWDSPWGKGFPGWHLECSAMSMKYLGEQFDIHCGGEDHVPIHHTNEIAQSEAATGKHPWVKYWMHNAFLVVDKGKMAKSEGDFLTLQKLVDEGYDPSVYRYFCLGAHYKQQLKFSFEGLNGAKNTFNRMKEKILELKGQELSNESVYQRDKTDMYFAEFKTALDDDLNTSQSLSVLWSVLRDNELNPGEKLELLYRFDEVLGFGLKEMKRDVVDVPDDVLDLLKERDAARAEKR
ncbi:MAG: cysteine--tRNA ligase [Candidatus Woesearchaeota archaeon]